MGASSIKDAPLLFGYMTQETAAILASAAVALFLGYLTLRAQARIERARLTFTTLNRNNWDREYIENRSTFVELREASNVILYAMEAKSDQERDTFLQTHLGGMARDEFKKRRSIIRSVLNNHENLATGIRRGILDEEYLFRYMRGIVVTDWKKMSPFVAELRQQADNSLLYAEFEGLATQWTNNRSYRKQTEAMPKLRRNLTVK